MRRAAWCLAALLHVPGALSAQYIMTVQDTFANRIEVGSCPLADRMLGPAPKSVLKAEVRGWFGPDSQFSLSSGQIKYKDEPPATLDINHLTIGHDSFPRGVMEAWFKSDIIDAPRNPGLPFTFIIDDTLKFPVGMPAIPAIMGDVPEIIFFMVPAMPKMLQAMVAAKKARMEYLGKRSDFRRRSLDEFAAATRLAICFRSGQGIQR
jgi:hypothetical protein